jgi:hypothetical protein
VAQLFCAGGGFSGEIKAKSKAFFFEKKKQKTFESKGPGVEGAVSKRA